MKIIKHLLSVMLITMVFSCVAFAAGNAVTPPPGDPLRKEILDALRHEFKKIHGMDVVFVVKHLKVKNGWAWIHVLPQSADGENKYEDISALMQLKWDVVEIPCTEEGDSNCLNGPEYFEQLQKRHPEVAAELLPDITSKSE